MEFRPAHSAGCGIFWFLGSAVIGILYDLSLHDLSLHDLSLPSTDRVLRCDAAVRRPDLRLGREPLSLDDLVGGVKHPGDDRSD